MQENTDVQIARLELQVKFLENEIGGLHQNIQQAQSASAVVGRLHDKISALEKQLLDAVEKIESLEKMADRWRGATTLLLVFGSIIGALISAWGTIVKAIR